MDRFPHLHETLRASVSENATLRKGAERLLQRTLVEDGLATALLRVYTSSSYALGTKLQALNVLKRTINACWSESSVDYQGKLMQARRPLPKSCSQSYKLQVARNQTPAMPDCIQSKLLCNDCLYHTC